MAVTQTKLSVVELQEKARIMRRHVIAMLGEAGSGHPGGSLSAAEIVACLFFSAMRFDPANSRWPDRDRFILSKGHACPILYAALAEAGCIPTSELMTLRKLDSRLQGHPSVKDLPVVEASTGSLGQGLSFAIGVALAGKLDGRKYHTYVLLGDGESQEGQVWEAAMAAVKYSLDSLTAIVDFNRFQLDDSIAKIMPALEPLPDKWCSFGWHVVEIDGHDISQVLAAINEVLATKGRPSVIVAHTVKGKGVSFMENDNEYHGKAPTKEQVAQALAELS